MQFDLTEFLSTEEPINRAELVLYLSQEPTDNSLQLRYATNNVWNDQAERKDEFCWDPSTTRSAINNSVIFDKKYDITGAKEGPVRFDILEFINYVKENYGTEQKSYTVDYVVTLVVRSGGSRAVNFYSQNAEEHLRPYIEFNYVPTEPTYDIVLNVGENGGIYSNREIVEAEGIKKLVIAEGGDAIIKVIPDAGYEIDTFTIDGEDALDLLNNYQLTLSEVQKNYVISATFKQTTANNIIYPLSDMALVLDNSKIDKTELRVKTATNVGSTTRVAYLKFDISNYDIQKGALLNLAALNNSSFTSGEVYLTVWGVNFADWDEADWESGQKKWQDMPINSLISLDSVINIDKATKINQTPISIKPGNAWYAINISDYLRAQKTSGLNTVTFVLTGTYPSSANILFGSKENINILDGKFCRPYISVLDIDYAVNVVNDENGEVKITLPDGTESGRVSERGTVIAHITSNQGYVLKSVSVNGVDMTNQVKNGMLYINNVTQDLEIVPVFTPARTLTFVCPDEVKIYDSQFNEIKDSITVAEGEKITVYFVIDAGYKMTLLENGLEAEGFAKNRIELTVLDDIDFEVQVESIVK